MIQKQIGFWRCRHCHKAWPSQMQAEMCFDLDMKELIAREENKEHPVKRNGYTIKQNE